jgi:hypothetical protein
MSENGAEALLCEKEGEDNPHQGLVGPTFRLAVYPRMIEYPAYSEQLHTVSTVNT